MATNILPHNLGEVIDASIAYLKNTDVTFEEINQIIKGPDFPTGGTIIGIKGIKDSQSSGRGSIIVQAKSNIEEFKTDREAIVFTEVPYQVNKSSLLEKIAELVRDKKIDEAAYSEFIEDYKNTYFKEVFDVLSSKYKLGRVRILLKEPRSTLSWHRDPEPRLHIPIITNPGSIMVIDNVAKHLPADGSVWITNNTKYHNAFNGGEENRIHLVACVLDYKFN